MTGLYVHVPFCARACPYCDFDFEVARTPDVDGYLEAMSRDWQSKRSDWGQLTLSTIYVGGGTPSQLGATGLERLLHWVGGQFDTSQVAECTVEVNPEHVNEELLHALRRVGVSRISLGIQSLQSQGLVQLGRKHRGESAIAAVRSCTAAGFETSVDLMVGWPGQTAAQLQSDLDMLTDSAASHISVYALTIEENSQWPRLVARKMRSMPDADLQADLLDQVQVCLTRNGFTHYEVASYARNHRYSLHNTLYWSWRSYLGLGPSAHSARYHSDGRVDRSANPRGLANWQRGELADAGESLSGAAAASEGLWLGLRRLQGFDARDYLAAFPQVGRDWLASKLKPCIAKGNVEWTAHDVIRVAAGRWLWHDQIAVDILEA